MKRSNQAGFGMSIVIIVIGVVLVIAISVFLMMKPNDKTSTTKATDTSVTVPAAPEVESSKDLTKAEETLDSTDVGVDASTDDSQLDTQLNGL